MATTTKEGHKAVSTQRARFLKAQAERAELKLKQEQGELVSAKEMEQAAFNYGRHVRDGLLNISPRVEAQIQSEIETATGVRIELTRIREILDKEITSVLTDLADGK